MNCSPTPAIKKLNTTIAVSVAILTLLPVYGLAWNVPGPQVERRDCLPKPTTRKAIGNSSHAGGPGEESLL